ncbi:MAG: hypothetical protein E7516_00490 [Ruminococcaceae bacterium]|nr:hypothetical protein [Oscillospiraceae bacterium]
MKKVKSLLSLILAVLMVAGCLVTAGAAEARVETEANNTVADANELEVGESITGLLEKADDKDCFVFETVKAGNATVKFTHRKLSADATYFTVTIKDASEKTVATFTSAGNSEEDSASFSVAEKETYYVVVEAGTVSDSTLDYTVAVSVEAVTYSEAEPNDEASKATALQYSPSGTPKEYYGSIGANDVDFYKFTIPANGVITLYLYNYAANKGNYTATLNMYVEENGVQVLKEVTAIEILATEASKIGASVGLAKGDYYLVVEGVEGSTGSYKTRVLFREVADAETEINDATTSADAITIGKTYKATLDSSNDVDCFKFTAPANNKGYNFDFKSTNAGSWKFEILNSDNVKVVDEVKLNATDSAKTAKAETLPLAAGTYYVKVTAGENHDEDIYELKVTEKTEALDDGKEENKSLIDRIKELDWGGLWGNFSEWIGEINFGGLISSIAASIAKLFTYFGSLI